MQCVVCHAPGEARQRAKSCSAMVETDMGASVLLLRNVVCSECFYAYSVFTCAVVYSLPNVYKSIVLRLPALMRRARFVSRVLL